MAAESRAHGCLYAAGFLAALLGSAVFLVPFQTILWDGGFPSAEYRLRFVDGNGRPVPGVELRVLTQAGGVSPFYPVNEFVPGRAVRSDADGRMAFSHVGTMEYDGREHRNLIGMRFGETRGPRYVCQFLLNGRVIAHEWYDELTRATPDSSRERVRRPSEHVRWARDELAAHTSDDAAWEASLFDGDRNGRFDREEGTALWYFRHASTDDGGDVELTVIERTVTLAGR